MVQQWVRYGQLGDKFGGAAAGIEKSTGFKKWVEVKVKDDIAIPETHGDYMIGFHIGDFTVGVEDFHESFTGRS